MPKRKRRCQESSRKLDRDMEGRKTSSLYVMRLKELREGLGISQSKLSVMSGVNVHHISKIECGRRLPNLETCLRLCHAMDVGLSDLVHFVKEEADALLSQLRSLDGGTS